MSVTKAVVGILPPFDGPDYGSIVVPDTPDLSTLIPELKQGIPYYVRICASNAMGSSPFITPYPQFQIPYQHQPAPPLEVSCLASKDGSTLLAVIIGAPFHDGGKMCRPIELIQHTAICTGETAYLIDMLARTRDSIYLDFCYRY